MSESIKLDHIANSVNLAFKHQRLRRSLILKMNDGFCQQHWSIKRAMCTRDFVGITMRNFL